jgi:hypothetical protein
MRRIGVPLREGAPTPPGSSIARDFWDVLGKQ